MQNDNDENNLENKDKDVVNEDSDGPQGPSEEEITEKFED